MCKNYEWYIKTDTKKYAGRWIAIVAQKIVASGNDAEKVYFQALKKYPKTKPSLAKVPDKQTLIFNVQTGKTEASLFFLTPSAEIL
ncbi:MAG: DUF5678 domain-containing protein [bacterium]